MDKTLGLSAWVRIPGRDECSLITIAALPHMMLIVDWGFHPARVVLEEI